MEYKYEPIFGDQSLFYGAPEDAVSVRYGKSEYIFDSDEIKATTGQLRDVPVVAMRRIIKTPVWTVADQKAGRLPEVGSKYLGKNELNPEAELICDLIDGDECVWGHDKNKKMFCFYASNIKPIETPAEKAQRLKSEWCAEAAKQLKNLEYTSTLISIYDALKSGELPMPNKE